MRRRLWWQITNLDRLGMGDRGSAAIIHDDSYNTSPPLNVNDEDLIPGSETLVQSRDCFTDSTFTAMILEAFHTERRLNVAPVDIKMTGYSPGQEAWSQRRGWVIDCQRSMEDKYIKYCDYNVPIQRFAHQVADIMNARLWLWCYRPLHRSANQALPTKIPYPGILHFAVEVIEKSAQIGLDPDFKRYLWVSNIWVQWHALAVMLAELCIQTQGPTVERAWAVAPLMFDETAKHVADSAKGRLWRPIKKLMAKAQAIRKRHLEDVALAKGLNFVGLGGQLTQRQTPNHYQPPEQLNNMEWTHAPSQPMQQTAMDTASPNVDAFSQGEPTGWNDWLDGTGPVVEMDQNQNNDVNQMSWNDWESFINDFQAPGEFMPGLDLL